MKIYLAARYSRNPEMREVRDRLVALGHTVTSRWIDQHGGTLLTSLPPERLNSEPEVCGHFAQANIDDLAAATVCISYTDTAGGGKGGRHVEFGVAYGLGHSVILVGPRENVFHCLHAVQVVADTDELCALLGEATP